MLNSAELEISTSHRMQFIFFSCLKHSDVVFILLINVKMPTIVGILTFMSMINFLPVELSMKKFCVLGCNVGYQSMKVDGKQMKLSLIVNVRK